MTLQYSKVWLYTSEQEKTLNGYASGNAMLTSKF